MRRPRTFAKKVVHDRISEELRLNRAKSRCVEGLIEGLLVPPGRAWGAVLTIIPLERLAQRSSSNKGALGEPRFARALEQQTFWDQDGATRGQSGHPASRSRECPGSSNGGWLFWPGAFLIVVVLFFFIGELGLDECTTDCSEIIGHRSDIYDE